jgi:hypothetical protein
MLLAIGPTAKMNRPASGCEPAQLTWPTPALLMIILQDERDGDRSAVGNLFAATGVYIIHGPTHRQRA